MLRIFALIWLLLPLCSYIPAQQHYRISTSAYIEQYKDIAILEMQRYGIPASIKLGQGILESGSGNSELAKNANNHFGIKCKSTWTGKTYHKDDDAKDECFRKYEKVLDSYEDHSMFLKQNQRYAFLFELDITDYKAWAHGLKKAGYATNPKYAELLIKTIEDNELHWFDKPDVIISTPPVTQIKTRPEKPVTEPKELEFKGKVVRPISLRNRIKSVVAKDGDTPESLAKELDVMSWQIVKYNDLEKGQPIQSGEIIYLQPKRRKAEDKTHQVQKGESLRDISQRYGIKQKHLRKYNQINDGVEIREGAVLRLR
ncbi:MAG: glucosaminidase domain-containing protein [Flavobacteriales bacterium]